MARKKDNAPQDNLTLDALDAQAAGMSYGQYKARHPRTAAANEHRLAPKKPVYQAPVYEHNCGFCDKTFYSLNKKKKYCSVECDHDARLLRNRESERRKAARKRSMSNEVQNESKAH